MQTIKKLGVMSVAKIEGVVGVIIGFIIGVLVFVLGAAASGVAGTGLGTTASLGALSIIIFPIFYGIILFIFGGLGAWIYNIIAPKVGGIQIELD